MPKNTPEYQRNYRQKQKSAPRAAQIEREMRQQFETAKKRLEAGLKGLLPGCNAYVKIVQAISDLEREYRQERAERGLDPESLGTAAKPGWHFVCHISTQGTPTVTEVPEDRVAEVLAQRAKKDTAILAAKTSPGDAELRAALDAEFGFGPGAEREENHD